MAAKPASNSALPRNWLAPDGKPKTRDMPKQERAQRRLRDILEAAARVLETRPPAELSASLIAEHAQIPVSSVYRYFATINDLIEELYLHATDDLRLRALDIVALEINWRERVRSIQHLIHLFLNDHPYYRALLVAIAANRGPQTVQQGFNDMIVTFLADRWRQGMDGFSGGDPLIVATTAVQIALSLEEAVLAQPTPAREAALTREMTQVLETYLARYLSDD